MNVYHRHRDRPRPTLLQRINPVWWLGDDTRPDGLTWWQNWRRNGASNFKSVIVGVADLEREFHSPDTDTIWSPDGRARWAWTTTDRHWPIYLPLFSFRTAHHEASWGWKPDGSFSVTWRRVHATEAKP